MREHVTANTEPQPMTWEESQSELQGADPKAEGALSQRDLGVEGKLRMSKFARICGMKCSLSTSNSVTLHAGAGRAGIRCRTNSHIRYDLADTQGMVNLQHLGLNSCVPQRAGNNACPAHSLILSAHDARSTELHPHRADVS
eukprot:143176-Chlamydomonas_euryale.AAC.5